MLDNKAFIVVGMNSRSNEAKLDKAVLQDRDYTLDSVQTED